MVLIYLISYALKMPDEETLHILLIDDDVVDRAAFKRHLGRCRSMPSYELHEADTLAMAEEAMECQRFDCVMLDFRLPDGTALDFFRKAKDKKTSDIPIIILTVLDDRALGLEMVEAGAQDYLVKGSFDDRLLEKTIRYAMERVKLLSAKNRLVKELGSALERIQTLEGIIPICSVCKKIRSDDGVWERMEIYVSKHTNAQFSHGFCEQCYETFSREQLEDPNGD